MSMERFCRKPVVTVGPDEKVDAIAQRMRDAHVGAVIVADRERHPLGIITDRDIVCRVAAERRSPDTLSAKEVMTSPVVVGKADGAIDEASIEMRRTGVRRLPLVDRQGHLKGIVSVDDLVVLLSAELGQTAQVVRENRGP